MECKLCMFSYLARLWQTCVAERPEFRFNGAACSLSGEWVHTNRNSASPKESNDSNPTCVNYVALTGDGAAVICGEKKYKSRNFFRQDHSLDRLTAENLGLVSLGKP